MTADILLAGLFLILILGLYHSLTPDRHQRNITAARKRLNKLRNIAEAPRQFAYLRTVDPYVFEEMILTAIRDQGGAIKRNKKYSSDSGIDGQAVINGERYLVQAKRYKSHINNQHVQEFASVCEERGTKGLFVHTGKTGKGVFQGLNRGHRIVIVSGQKMLNMLNGKQLPL